MIRRFLTILVILVCATAALAQSARARIDKVKAAIEAGTVSPERDIGPLIEMARKARGDDQRDLISRLADLGAHDGSSPAAVKKYINETLTPVLIAVASDKSNSNFLRGDAIHAMRDLGSSRAALEEVARMAMADSDGYVKSRGEIIDNYVKSLPAEGRDAAIQPTDPAAEREALAFLKSRRLGASADQLNRSAMEGKADEVRALLAAGVPVDGEGMMSPLQAAMVSCFSAGESDDLLATVDALLAGGANVKAKDGNGNTVLFSAAQQCGPNVVARLVAAGADPNVVNGTGFTPLMLAIVSSRFEAAEGLLAAGAKLTKEQAATVASMDDPKVKAFVAKATAGAKKK